MYIPLENNFNVLWKLLPELRERPAHVKLANPKTTSENKQCFTYEWWAINDTFAKSHFSCTAPTNNLYI